MKQLHVYPTARALRAVSSTHKDQDALLPALMRMDEFEKRAILIDGKIEIDPLQRILLLREAANFEAFRELKFDLDLVKFFTKSDALFKFFEEMKAEHIEFDTLVEADAYVEFESHLQILEALLENYHSLLDAKGLTDGAFIPSEYSINSGFLQRFDTIEIHLEGYLSKFELELLEAISQHTELIIHYATSRFNLKMQDRFHSIGMTLPNDSMVSFDMRDRRILHHEQNSSSVDARVYVVEERQEQIAMAFVEIELMVRSGISPEDIVLILPDEEFKEQFRIFDIHNNLNFAMGYSYSKTRVFKSLEALYVYWQQHSDESRYLLGRYGLDVEKIDEFGATHRYGVEGLFEVLGILNMVDFSHISSQTVSTAEESKQSHNEQTYERYMHFCKIFDSTEMSLKEWLFLWIKSLSTLTTDDLHGGKITVMGVLETRGIGFEGVVIVDFNDGIVPASSAKDQFLNSTVRAFANLPTKSDREGLQKQYYKRLLEQAEQAVILYSSSDSKLPSKFLYELGLDRVQTCSIQHTLLYAQPSQIVEESDPVVEFDATAIVWSASRLQTYLECKRKYYHRYIQKIKAKSDTELNEGAFLHSILEHLYLDSDSYGSHDELLRRFDELLGEMLPYDDSKTAYRKLLWRERLSGFMRAQIEHFGAEWRVVAREVEVVGNIGGLEFRGRIDRIDQNATDTLVLDYKSGTVPKEPKSLNPDKTTDFQMSIYHQLLRGKYQNIRLAFLKLFEDGAMQEVTLLEEREELLAEQIVSLKQSRTLTATKCEELSRCRYCEFALMCGRGDYL